MAIKKKTEIKEKPAEKPVEKAEVKKPEKRYICIETCYHRDTMYKKGDILVGEPPKGKDGEVKHFEEEK